MSLHLPYLRIKYERHRRGWLQRDVARHPEVHNTRPRLRQDDISEIELGRRNPTPEQLAALGRAFGISPASVLLKPCAFVDPEEQQQPEVAAR